MKIIAALFSREPLSNICIKQSIRILNQEVKAFTIRGKDKIAVKNYKLREIF